MKIKAIHIPIFLKYTFSMFTWDWFSFRIFYICWSCTYFEVRDYKTMCCRDSVFWRNTSQTVHHRTPILWHSLRRKLKISKICCNVSNSNLLKKLNLILKNSNSFCLWNCENRRFLYTMYFPKIYFMHGKHQITKHWLLLRDTHFANTDSIKLLQKARYHFGHFIKSSKGFCLYSTTQIN